MFALAASFLIHTAPQAPPPPQAQVAQIARAVPFHLVALPLSAELLGARLEPELDGSLGAHLEYSIEGKRVDIDERLPAAGETPPQNARQLFSLDGYPAVFRPAQSGYNGSDALTWYRPDIIIAVWSPDRADAPLLIDLALDLR